MLRDYWTATDLVTYVVIPKNLFAKSICSKMWTQPSAQARVLPRTKR